MLRDQNPCLCTEAGATTICCDLQGGTCVLVGDDVKKVAEAGEFAKKLIGCKIMQNKPYYRTAGHVQVCKSSLSPPPATLSNHSTLLGIKALHTPLSPS